MMLIDLWFPQNVQEFFAGIFDLLAFDFVPTERLYGWLFGFKDVPFAD